MKKRKNYALIGLISIILGVFLSMQFKVINTSFLNGESPFGRATELTKKYKELLDERDLLRGEVTGLEQEITNIEESISKDNYVLKNLTDEVNYYKMIGGFLDVKGEGITVIIDNPPKDLSATFEVDIVYDYELLLLLVNELNAAGAEAIEINGQRIISLSEIRTAGNAININAIPQYPPFTINAIGSKDTLEGALQQRFGLVSVMRDKGYFVEVRKVGELSIKKYDGKPTLKYIETIKE